MNKKKSKNKKEENKGEIIELLACKWRVTNKDKFDLIRNAQKGFYDDCISWGVDPLAVLKEI